MKKLLIVVSVLATALSLEAASYIWGFTANDYVNAKGEGYNSALGINAWDGGKAYLYLGTVTASKSAFNFSDATLITSAAFNSLELIYGNSGATGYSESGDITSTTAGQDFTLILVDNTSKDLSSYEGNYVLYKGTSKEGTILGTTTSHYASFLNTDAVTQSSWQSMTASVPEPTSGLLLLLGVAGLALRRKRA